MKKNLIYLIELLLFIFVIIFSLFYKSELIINILMILIAIFSVIYFGFYKDNSYLKPIVTRTVIACLLSFFVIIYLIGLFTGFNNTVFSLRLSYLFRNVILLFLAIASKEIIRYIVAKKSVDSKKPIIFYTIILIILNVITEINGYDLTDSEGIFIFICVVILPAISRELLCSYLTYKVSYIPSLIFMESINMYEYVFPLIPNLGYYLYASCNILLCYFIYFFSSKFIDLAEKAKSYVKKTTIRILYIPIIIFLGIIILLVSGIFKYQMIAIGSNSMVPTYYRGDAVIFKKVDTDEIKTGDILVFEKNNLIVTHRVTKIYGNNSHKYKTKGDANNSEDAFDVKEDEIIGIVKCRIKFVGYPTLWLNELFKGREIND